MHMDVHTEHTFVQRHSWMGSRSLCITQYSRSPGCTIKLPSVTRSSRPAADTCVWVCPSNARGLPPSILHHKQLPGCVSVCSSDKRLSKVSVTACRVPPVFVALRQPSVFPFNFLALLNLISLKYQHFLMIFSSNQALLPYNLLKIHTLICFICSHQRSTSLNNKLTAWPLSFVLPSLVRKETINVFRWK